MAEPPSGTACARRERLARDSPPQLPQNSSPTEQVSQIDKRNLKELVAFVSMQSHVCSGGAAPACQRAIPLLEHVRERLASRCRTGAQMVEEANVAAVHPMRRGSPPSGNGRDQLVLSTRIANRVRNGHRSDTVHIAMCRQHRGAEHSGGVPTSAQPDARRTRRVEPLADGVREQLAKNLRPLLEPQLAPRLEPRWYPVARKLERRRVEPRQRVRRRNTTDGTSARARLVECKTGSHLANVRQVETVVRAGGQQPVDTRADEQCVPRDGVNERPRRPQVPGRADPPACAVPDDEREVALEMPRTIISPRTGTRRESAAPVCSPYSAPRCSTAL